MKILKSKWFLAIAFLFFSYIAFLFFYDAQQKKLIESLEMVEFVLHDISTEDQKAVQLQLELEGKFPKKARAGFVTALKLIPSEEFSRQLYLSKWTYIGLNDGNEYEFELSSDSSPIIHFDFITEKDVELSDYNIYFFIDNKNDIFPNSSSVIQTFKGDWK